MTVNPHDTTASAPGDPLADELNWGRSDAEPFAADVQPELAPGSRVGRYVVGEVLGRGGMGVVYRAEDPELGRTVALKVVRRGPVGFPELLGRFAFEARVTARLEHPAIIPVYDVGLADQGRLFYTMRYVRGRTLESLLREGMPLPTWRLARVRELLNVERVCQAVAYAHDRGIVHRDLKPSNLIVGRFEQVYVLDWGLAKSTNERDLPPAERSQARIEGVASADDTEHGLVLGSMGYMAPEQARCEAIGPSADVYALGGILYTVLTRRRPREGEARAELLVAAQAGTLPRRPRDLAPDVPRDLEDLCLAALAPEPAGRPPSASVMADALLTWLDR